MTTASVNRKISKNAMRWIFVASLSLCVLVAGAWALWRGRTQVAASRALISAGLAAFSQAPGTSSIDQEIVRWTEQVKQASRNESAWVNLGNALVQKTRQTSDASYYNRAESSFRKALSLNAKNVYAMVGISWVYGFRHEFEQSIEWANKAVVNDPKNQDAYGLLGDAAVEMGDYEAAFANYQKMLDIRPDLSSYSRGAHLLYLAGDFRKATWLMQKAIAAGGPYAEDTAWCNAQLALMLWNNGALLPAEQILQKGLEQSPNNYHLLVAMGKVKASKRDYSAAIDFYKKAIGIAPQHEVVVALGDLYMVAGQKDEAEKQYAMIEAIHKINQDNGVRDEVEMARFYADHGRNLRQALEMAEVAFRECKSIPVIDTLAWCYYQNCRYDDARTAILKALRLGTKDATMLFHAGMIHAKLGIRSEAQKFLYQALSLNPNFHPFQASLAADTLKKLAEKKGNG